MKKYIALIAAVLLAACAMQTSTRPQSKFAYEQYPSTYLSVANIQVVNDYSMPAASPNVEHLMPLPLPTAIEKWAKKRFIAGGADGT